MPSFKGGEINLASGLQKQTPALANDEGHGIFERTGENMKTLVAKESTVKFRSGLRQMLSCPFHRMREVGRTSGESLVQPYY